MGKELSKSTWVLGTIAVVFLLVIVYQNSQSKTYYPTNTLSQEVYSEDKNCWQIVIDEGNPWQWVDQNSWESHGDVADNCKDCFTDLQWTVMVNNPFKETRKFKASIKFEKTDELQEQTATIASGQKHTFTFVKKNYVYIPESGGGGYSIYDNKVYWFDETVKLSERKEYICGDEKIKKEIDISKIEASIKDKNFNLYLNNMGGVAEQKGYVTVVNNDDLPIQAFVFCTSSYGREYWLQKNIVCLDSEIVRIEPHTTRSLDFSTYVGIKGKPGSYNAKVQVKVYDSEASWSDIQEEKISGRIVVEKPIILNIHCATGCCKSGTYNYRDCT